MKHFEGQNGDKIVGNFIKLSTTGMLDIVQLTKESKIHGRDITVLMMALYFCNWKTGKSRFTIKKLSEMLDTATTNIRASMKRLRACGLLVEAEDRDGTPYFIPHPKIFVCSTGKARGLLLKTYYKAIHGQNFEDCIQDAELEMLTGYDEDSTIHDEPF